VILLHGAAGVLPYVTEWQQELASMGVAAFVVDSFTPRGIRSAPRTRIRWRGSTPPSTRTERSRCA